MPVLVFLRFFVFELRITVAIWDRWIRKTRDVAYGMAINDKAGLIFSKTQIF